MAFEVLKQPGLSIANSHFYWREASDDTGRYTLSILQ